MERYSDLNGIQQAALLEGMNQHYWELCEALAAIVAERAFLLNVMKNTTHNSIVTPV